MKPTSPRVILFLSYMTYLLFGAFTAAVGPVLGELSQRTSSSLAAMGGVVTFLFLGAIVAQILAGPITDRWGHQSVLIVSLLILGFGILSFTNARTLPFMFMLVLFTGFGQGGVDMGANLVVADAAPGRTTAALNLLHFFFGLGAFVGPALVGLSITLADSGLLVLWGTAALFILLGLANAALLRRSPQPSGDPAPAPDSAPRGLRIYLSPLLWLMGILMLVYVGVEIAIGTWISAYMGITTGALPQFGAWITSAFWAALALGRLVGAAVSSRLTRMQLLTAALGGSMLGGIALFMSNGSLVPTILSLAWIGFAYATCYPTTIALVTSAFAAARGKAVSVVVTMGSLGAATLPLLAGALLEANTVTPFLSMIVLGLAILLLLLYPIGRLLGRRPDSPG